MSDCKSLIALPNTFVCIDTETTGLDFEYDNIIELSAIKYINGIKTDSFSTLVKPPIEEVYFPFRGENGTFIRRYVPEFITELTGITDEMLETAPEISEALPPFLSFIGDLTLVGQNTSFDVRFIQKGCQVINQIPIENEFINIMRIARKVFPGRQHYRLSDIAEMCGVDYQNAHRALGDCTATSNCYLHMRETILKTQTEAEFQSLFIKKRISYSSYIQGLVPQEFTPDEDNLIYGKTFVFTGTLEKMPRKEALRLVLRLGGIPSDRITQSVDFLVVGNTDFISSIKDEKTAKMKKAESYAAKGFPIRIISENTFYNMIDM